MTAPTRSSSGGRTPQHKETPCSTSLTVTVPATRGSAPRRKAATDEQPALPAEVDVLIVGSGPAGLLLAAQLSQFPEIVTRVVEKATARSRSAGRTA